MGRKAHLGRQFVALATVNYPVVDLFALVKTTSAGWIRLGNSPIDLLMVMRLPYATLSSLRSNRVRMQKGTNWAQSHDSALV